MPAAQDAVPVVPRISTVLFDLDGTLTDSAAGIIDSYRYALGKLGLQAGDGAIRACIGPPIHAGLCSLGVPEDKMEDAIFLYREYFSVTGIFANRLYEGVGAMLQELRARGRALGVATAKPEPYAKTILDHFGVARYFDAVSGSSFGGRLLDKVEIVSHALDLLGGPASAGVAMVGDREHDMYAARRLGLAAIGATWGYGTEEELLGAGAQALAASPAEVAGLLG